LSLDEKLARTKELIAQREAIDAELSELLGVTPAASKQKGSPRACSRCGEPGHRSSTCTKEPKKEDGQPSLV
jgi:hypothetical protein